MRVLIVEDDRIIATAVRRGLNEEGFSVDAVEDGEEAIAAAVATPFDAVILDVMLPGAVDGFQVCSALRSRRIRTPVLMLTARDAVDDRVRGLEAGADDYLVKPFAFRELLARVRALTRRHLDARSRLIEAGALTFDVSSRQASVRGTPLPLTAKELAILEYFLHHQGQLLTRAQIEEHVWNYDFDSNSNLVEVYVGRIRRKLTLSGLTDPIVTQRGEGYRFDPIRLCDDSSVEPAFV
jgi:DNA-binding response OmpR family regulator